MITWLEIFASKGLSGWKTGVCWIIARLFNFHFRYIRFSLLLHFAHFVAPGFTPYLEQSWSSMAFQFVSSVQCTPLLRFIKCCLLKEISKTHALIAHPPPNSTLSTSTEKNWSALSSLSLEGVWRQHIANQVLVLLLEELYRGYALHNNLAEILHMQHVKH